MLYKEMVIYIYKMEAIQDETLKKILEELEYLKQEIIKLDTKKIMLMKILFDIQFEQGSFEPQE
jgi:predicted transcriptional regulator